jgi:glyoxylase-like metal-dependent hydrolase (beta-lactamase superfamily II)
MYGENGMVLSLGEARPCWIIDPGLPPQAEQILAYIDLKQLTPAAIVLTHAHGDHIAGVDDVRAKYADLPLYLAREEWPMLGDPAQNLSGAFGAGVRAKSDNLRDLVPGESLELDGTTWDVFDTSGHSPGGRTIHCQALGVAIVGDAVFAGSIGRTDFPHSDGERLLRNIHEQILTLPDDTTLIPGHGPSTTVRAERTSNPYLIGHQGRP